MEPNILYSTLEIKEFCRVCLKASINKSSIWDTIIVKDNGNIQFAEMIMECTTVIVEEDDELPKYICFDCSQQLENAYCFKHRCEKSDTKLKQIFEILKATGESCKYILIENPGNLSNLKVENENQENDLGTIEEIIQNKNELLKNGEFIPKTEKLDEIEEIFLNVNKAEDVTSESTEDNTDGSNKVPKKSTEIKSKLEVDNFSSGTICPYCSKRFKNEKNRTHHENYCEKRTSAGKEYSLSANESEDFAQESGEDVTPESDDDDIPELNENLSQNALKIEPQLKTSVNDFAWGIIRPHSLRTYKGKKSSFIHGNYREKPTSTDKEYSLSVNGIDVVPETTECVTPRPQSKENLPKSVNKIELKLKRPVNDFSSALTCPYCLRKFKSKMSLTLHENHCQKETFNCGQCSETFPHQSLLNSHLSTTHGEAPAPLLTCDICSDNFKDKSSLIEHFYVHIETSLYFNYDFDGKSETYLCYPCNKNFSSAQQLIKHCNEHSQSKDYRCRKCNEAFEEYSLLKKHIREHGILPYFCDKCLLNFDSVRKMQLHQKTQHLYLTIKDTLECPLCEDVFKDLFKLKNHLKEHKADLYKCLECFKSYKSIDEFNNHKKDHNVCSLCYDCGKQFPRTSSLDKHIRVHHMKMTQVTCNVCNKILRSKKNLDVHKLIHTKEKPYSCSYCPYRTIQSQDLKKHIRIHTGETPYACKFPNCDQKFKTSSNRNEHHRQHTGERNYECKICKMKFGKSGVLRNHMLIHSNKKEHKCGVCGKQFRRKHHLTIHKLKIHGISNVKCNKI